jgi:hypothetical protein
VKPESDEQRASLTLRTSQRIALLFLTAATILLGLIPSISTQIQNMP